MVSGLSRFWRVTQIRHLLVVFGFAVAAGLILSSTAHALDIPQKPTDVPVVDQTNTLSQSQKQAIADKIAKERSATGNQVGVLMIKTLDGDALEDYSLEVARGWGIGQKERNSGVLLLVVKDDRKLRIEVGYGLEGALTDARSAQIIRNRITPQFKAGKYYEGIDSGVDGILTAIHGEVDPQLGKKTTSSGWSKVPWEAVFWGVIFVPIWLGSILARTKSWWAGGVVGGAVGIAVGFFFGFLFIGLAAIVGLAVFGLGFDKLVSDNYQKHAGKKGSGPPSWWAGGPWIGGGGIGGSSSGGFGGFSGGSFGGGGSSGSW